MIISFLPEVDRDNFRFGHPFGYTSLCSCALVCHNWLPASRHILFTHVEIVSDERYTLFVSSAVLSQQGRSWLPSIRRFTLHDRRSYKPGAQHSTRLFIHELGGQFPNLEELHLDTVNFNMTQSSLSPRKFAALSAFASVQTLNLWYCMFPSFAALRYTLISLSSLTDLSLTCITWPTTGVPELALLPFLRSPGKSPFLRTIRCLDFNGALGGVGTCDDQILRWLSTTSLAVSLSELRVSSAAFMKVPQFWEYVGSSITRISITVTGEGELLDNST